MAIEIKKNFTAEQSPSPEKSLENNGGLAAPLERTRTAPTAP